MLGMEARLRNRRGELRQFLNRFCPTLDRPRRRFFFQSVGGILLSGSVVVARWLRFVHDRCRQRFWRQKRLLNQINHGKWDQGAVLSVYQRQWGRNVAPDTPLIVDLSDLPRPRARKLKYLSLVRDGSEGSLVNGYWCLEIYARWNKHCITPLLLRPYSSEDPAVFSENAMILRGVDEVFTATEGRGVLVMDRGADRSELLIPWIDADRRFVVCQRGDRHVILDNAAHLEASLLIDRLLEQTGRRVVWCKVRLPQRPDRPLWLVGKVLPGKDRPLIVLSTLRCENLEQAKVVLQYYRWRWSCEEAARFLKSGLGLEQIALRKYESFARLLLLAMLAMGFLSWLALRRPTLIRWLCDARAGLHKIKFGYYRLLNWFNEQITHINTARFPP
ncbi:MAG: transposase [Tepidisphaeraceae bacterium]